MALGWQQLLIVLALALLLFGGRGRISSLMGDMAKGIKSFRSGLKEEDAEPAAAQASLKAEGTPGQAAPEDKVETETVRRES